MVRDLFIVHCSNQGQENNVSDLFIDQCPSEGHSVFWKHTPEWSPLHNPRDPSSPGMSWRWFDFEIANMRWHGTLRVIYSTNKIAGLEVKQYSFGGGGAFPDMSAKSNSHQGGVLWAGTAFRLPGIKLSPCQSWICSLLDHLASARTNSSLPLHVYLCNSVAQKHRPPLPQRRLRKRGVNASPTSLHPRRNLN